jgi:flagellar hook-length control protein FliK
MPQPTTDTPIPAVPVATAPAAADHKITLRPIEADAAPTRPNATADASPDQVVPAATTTPVSTTASVAAPAPTHHPASPADQVAPTLLTLAKTAEGGQQMTVRLQPADLGMVQVKIERALSGATQIDITADNPATLLALQRDQPQLHRTLDDAGIPAAGRTVTFHTAQVAQAAASSASGSPAGHNANQQGSPNRTSTNTTDADGSSSGGRGSYLGRERNTYPTSRRSAPLPTPPGAKAATVQAYRIGLDITA